MLLSKIKFPLVEMDTSWPTVVVYTYITAQYKEHMQKENYR
jgi:hypothetical protein